MISFEKKKNKWRKHWKCSINDFLLTKLYDRVVEKFDTGRKTDVKRTVKILIKYLWLNKDTFFRLLYIFKGNIKKKIIKIYLFIFCCYLWIVIIQNLQLLNNNIISKSQLFNEISIIFFFNIEHLNNFSCWFSSFEHRFIFIRKRKLISFGLFFWKMNT